MKVVEDCAEALGATYKNRKVGLDGDCTTFSFFPNKLITTGEGGMVVFKSQKDASKARQLLNQGRSNKKKYWHEYAGLILDDQSSGSCRSSKLKKLIFFKKKKYSKFMTNFLKKHNFIGLLPKNKWSTNSYWLYILIKNIGEKNKLQNYSPMTELKQARFYPLHSMRPFSKFGKGHIPYPMLIELTQLAFLRH